MNNDEIDIEHLKNWIGKTEESTDFISAVLVDRFKATFTDRLWEKAEVVPLGIHWCLALPCIDIDQLGEDGHALKGGFLPPVPLPSRMWAGGEIKTNGTFKVGDVVTKRSKIVDVILKQGKSGALVFVNVEHEYWVEKTLIVVETHNIVYKSAAKPNLDAVLKTPKFDVEPDRSNPELIVVDEVTMFRYSAITFNSHRIHYDRTYTQQQEGYEGLVVHGPLQATLLLNEAAKICDGPPKKFKYRGISPLIEQTPFRICEAPQDAGGDLWCEDFTGRKTMKSSYYFY